MVLAEDEGDGLMLEFIWQIRAKGVLLAAALLIPTIASADSLALILNGIPGSPEHEERFARWTDQTRSILIDTFGFSDEDVIVLNQPDADEIRGAFAGLAGRVGEADVFYLFLIGHGSYDRGEYKFNIARADLTAADYSDLLTEVGAGRTVVVNATTSSGASIEALAAQNRVIITATRTGTERNDTVFYEHFLEGLTDSASDEDLNQRLSVWEAFRYAALAVERFYSEQNLLATEHPQISDNGGEQTGTDTDKIPVLAQVTNFNVAADVSVDDPVLSALLEERQKLEQEIATLRVDQEVLAPEVYEQRLEDLLVELALKNQEIRAREGEGTQ